MVNSDGTVLRQSLQSVMKWIKANWTDVDVIEMKMEFY